MAILQVSYLCHFVFVSLEMGTRNGTDVDAAFAVKTFSELGYQVKIFNDQTVSQMTSLMFNGNRNLFKNLFIQ